MSCPDQSVHEASASSITTEMFEPTKSHMKGDRTSRTKLRIRHGKLFLSQRLQSKTSEEMRRRTKTVAGAQSRKEDLIAIAKRFNKEKKRLSSVQQDTEVSQDDPDGLETNFGTLETEGSNEEPVKCLTEEEVRAFALQRAENCARNRNLSHKRCSNFKRR